MKLINLPHGKFTKVDNADYEWLNSFKWHVTKDGYVRRSWRHGNPTLLHRLILAAPNDKEVDHKNNDPLDNQRHNLRLALRGQNQSNTKVYKTSKSGFKGVRKNHNLWQAIIQPKGRFISLGYYKTPEEAALAYNNSALQHYGEFARLNDV